MIEQEWVWATAGSILLLIEIFLGTQFFLFFMGISCYLSALVFYMYPDISYSQSLLVIAFFFCLSPAVWFKFFKPYFVRRGNNSDVNSALVGLKGHSITLENDMQSGRVKVRIKHSLWDVKSVNGESYKAGDNIKVVDIDGVTLIVEKQ